MCECKCMKEREGGNVSVLYIHINIYILVCVCNGVFDSGCGCYVRILEQFGKCPCLD